MLLRTSANRDALEEHYSIIPSESTSKNNSWQEREWLQHITILFSKSSRFGRSFNFRKDWIEMAAHGRELAMVEGKNVWKQTMSN
mmetsp:Transcript_63528/g.71903  ORF Transcript_63528/g.71903 Transcript_63528/m.71903 type:complete len:85 (+) Transcript_63528:67-321(+)